MPDTAAPTARALHPVGAPLGRFNQAVSQRGTVPNKKQLSFEGVRRRSRLSTVGKEHQSFAMQNSVEDLFRINS